MTDEIYEMTGHAARAQLSHSQPAGRQRDIPAGTLPREGSGQAYVGSQPTVQAPDRKPSASAEPVGGQVHGGTQPTIAFDHPNPAAMGHATSKSQPPQEGEAVHPYAETHLDSDRFADPLIAEIVETWRSRQDMVRAQQKLTLQRKAICRRFTEGDKAEADKLYRSINNGMGHPLAEPAAIATMALRLASEPVEAQRKAYEKHLAKLGKNLPIAHMAERIKGVNHGTLATIVGEVGDMSAYQKGVAGIWKRAGLAVIDGERQRKKAGDAALLHGYSPSRRSVFWNIGASLIKAQGKGDDAGPYRLIYDERKAYERPRVETDGHAHNRAMRFMVKRLLKDLWAEWRAVARDLHGDPS